MDDDDVLNQLMGEVDCNGDFMWEISRPRRSKILSIRDEIAVTIERGAFQGKNWNLEINTDRLMENNVETVEIVLKNIAQFIRDGLDKGISPCWILTIDGGK